MDKKKVTSWGVSFASLALVAGMMSYMGATNKNTKVNQSASQEPSGQSPNQNESSSENSG